MSNAAIGEIPFWVFISVNAVLLRIDKVIMFHVSKTFFLICGRFGVHWFCYLLGILTWGHK